MKKLLLSVLALWAVGAVGQTVVNSTVERVTIFPQGALVEKCATVNLKKGENKFVIAGNAVNIDQGTLQFASSPKWLISSSNIKACDLPVSAALNRVLPAAAYAQYQTLAAKVNDLTLKIENNDDMISFLLQQHAALFDLKAVRETKTIDTVGRIKTQFDFQLKEAKANNTTMAKAKKENEEYRYQLQTTQAEIDKIVAQYTGGTTFYPNQNEIEVCIVAGEAVNGAKVKYSYRVANSVCSYSYDALLDEAEKRAVFCLKGNVMQNTGEHWRDCEIVFSTTEAGNAGYDRMLPTYYIDFNNYNTTRATESMAQKRVMANAYVMEEEVFVVNELNVVDSKSKSLAMPRPAAMQNLTLSRDFTLNTHQAIASGSPAQMMLLAKDTTAASFARFTTPKNEEKVHYTAMLPDWEDLGLLDVECNVYLNDKYVSKSAIQTAGMGDTLRFAVGEDRNVKVSRRMHKATPDKSGLLSKDLEVVVDVTLTVKNTKSEAIDLSMKDQIPVSKNVEIRVINVQTDGGALDENTGIIRWNLKLEPREERKVTFSYTVKYPKDKTVIVN